MINRQDDSETQVNHVHGVYLSDRDSNKEGEEH